MGRSNNFARVGLACSAHLGGNTLRDLVGHIRTTVSRPLRKISSYLPIIIAVCCVPKLVSLVSTAPAPSCYFVLCVLVSLLGTESIWYGLPNGFNLQSSHHRGCNPKSTQLGTQAENPGRNMVLLSALRSCGIGLCPWIGPEQIGPALDLGNRHSASPAALPVTSSETLPEPLRCDHAEISLDFTVFTAAAPQVHATQFMRLDSLDVEGDVLGTMVKGITHIQPQATPNHDGIPKPCSNTADPISSFTIPNRFDARSNVKASDRWIFAQLLCFAILYNLGSRCVQSKSFWASLQTMIKFSELPQGPKNRSQFPITPRPPTSRLPRRRAPRMGKLFVLGSLFLYTLSSGLSSSVYSGFGDSGGSGQSPNDTNPGSQQENGISPSDDPYYGIPLLDDLGPQGTGNTDENPIHGPGTLASPTHNTAGRPIPEQVDSVPTSPPPLAPNALQGGAEPHAGGAPHVTPTPGYFDYRPSPQPSAMGNYGTQTPHHPPAPQPPSHPSPSQIPPQSGMPNGTELYAHVTQTHAPSIDIFQIFVAVLVQHAQQGRSLGTSTPLGDVGPDYLRQWVSILGQPDPPLQPGLDEHDQLTYSRGYADARHDLITGLVEAAGVNPQLARAEPSIHAQEESEVPVSLLPVAPTPQSDQVVSNPSPPTAAQEVSNKPGSEPYAPPTPPCENTDPEPSPQTLGASADPTIDPQAPHQESRSVPDAQNVDHHTPGTIHAPQPVAPVPVTSSPPQPPAPAPTSTLVPAAPHPSLPTPAATPVTQGETNRPHVCGDCGKAYGRPYLLRDHIKSKHRNEKPFACDFEGCTSRFTTRSNQRKHFGLKHRGSGTPHGNDTNQASTSG